MRRSKFRPLGHIGLQVWVEVGLEGRDHGHGGANKSDLTEG